MNRHADERVCLGPAPIHTDHAVVLAHNYLDTGGYRTYR
ncbi:MAG: tRNA (pseudouridine(54)-N(1))-methyltransferase [Methanonatronarchaeales archaeon]|nr:tRNA (pseudouridine(54)-N(1))-methyltransferase [Methanonatronarchaeales archaeon]